MLAAVPAWKRATSSEASRLWRAKAMLRHDRWSGLGELGRCFAAGAAPEGLEGSLDGRLITTTMGRV